MLIIRKNWQTLEEEWSWEFHLFVELLWHQQGTVSVFLVDLALVLRLVMVLGLLSELLPVFDKKVKKIIHIYQLMYHINIHDSKYGRLQLKKFSVKSEKKLIGYWRIFIKTYPWCFLICIPTDKHWVVIFDQRCVWRNHDFCSMSWFTRDCFLCKTSLLLLWQQATAHV